MKPSKILHLMEFYSDEKSACGLATLKAGNHTIYKNSTTCKRCKAHIKALRDKDIERGAYRRENRGII